MTFIRCWISLLVAAMITVGSPALGWADESESVGNPPASKLFRLQYHIDDSSFCNAGACVDLDNDGRRELLFASRETQKLQALNAADGSVKWSRAFPNKQQSIAAFDLNQDGQFEILYSTSNPGQLYVLDDSGELLGQWNSGDWKLGNSAVVVDADGDGVLEGFFGSRGKYLIRLNMKTLSVIERRKNWVQCGCHTSALDVDRDGKWDFFAGMGDDSASKGTVHRYDPISLKSLWSFDTNDNASSADPVLVDIDGDGQVEIVKSVDNYARDDAHDAVYALETDGSLIWKVAGLSGEDSPNVADLDGDGDVEIVGMTFGGEVYCLNAKGQFKWRKDLRPELDNGAHSYMAPILCDLNGDRTLEILAMTNDGDFDEKNRSTKKNAILFALTHRGEILDRFDLGGPRYWGEAFLVNVDDDPFQELVLAGSGGLDVIETRGFGTNKEYFQRRRTYQRLNVYPWAYEVSFFIERGSKRDVTTLTDNLVLKKSSDAYVASGTFTTEILSLPPACFFDRLSFQADTPQGTIVNVSVLNAAGKKTLADVKNDQRIQIREPIRLRFELTTSEKSKSPKLDAYALTFDRIDR